jgi:hypothetical protein
MSRTRYAAIPQASRIWKGLLVLIKGAKLDLKDLYDQPRNDDPNDNTARHSCFGEVVEPPLL